MKTRISKICPYFICRNQNIKHQNNLTSWFGARDCYLSIMANNFHNFLIWRPGSQQVWPPYATATRALCQKRSRCVLLLVLCPYSTYRRKWLAAAIFGECSALESSFATSYLGTIHILLKHFFRLIDPLLPFYHVFSTLRYQKE